MSDKLSTSQREMVARAVLGNQVSVHKWEPENEFWQWQMLIEWIAKVIVTADSINFSKFDKSRVARDVMELIYKSDINGLEAEVFEMVDYESIPIYSVHKEEPIYDEQGFTVGCGCSDCRQIVVTGG